MMRLLASALVIMALALTGCARTTRQSTTVEPEPQILATMPDLVGESLEQASATLGQAPIALTVVFPGYDALWSEEATYIAGTPVPSHDETVSVEGRTLALSEVQSAKHRIVSQSPPPGTPLSEVTTATVTAGPHPNETGLPWLTSGHAMAVQRGGAATCLFECHTEAECAKCHQELLRN